MFVILTLIGVHLLNFQSNSLLITPETNDPAASVHAILIQNHQPQPADGQSWLLSTNTQMDSPNYNMVLRIKHPFDLEGSFSKTNIKITIDGELGAGGDPMFLFSDGNKYFSNDAINIYPKCTVGYDSSTFPTGNANNLFSGYSHATSRNAFAGGDVSNFYRVTNLLKGWRTVSGWYPTFVNLPDARKQFPFILTFSADHINSLFMYTFEAANNAYSCQYNDIFDYNAEYFSLYLSMEWSVAESIQINSFNVEFETVEYVEITPGNNVPSNPFYIEIAAPAITVNTTTGPHYWSINNEAAQNFALQLYNSEPRLVFRKGMETTLKVAVESQVTTAMGMAFGVGDKYISSIFEGTYGCGDRVKGITTANFGHNKYMLWLDSSRPRITIGSCCSLLNTVLTLYDANGDYVSVDYDGKDSDCNNQAVLKTQIASSGYYTLDIAGHHVKVTLARSDYFCGNQDKNLGTFKTKEECGYRAFYDPSCTGDQIMIKSITSNYECRCCAQTTGNTGFTVNTNWDVYTYSELSVSDFQLKAGCSQQQRTLGYFFTKEECAIAAHNHPSCTSNLIMFSQNYKTWKCRCCMPNPTTKTNKNWNVYKYDKFMSYGYYDAKIRCSNSNYFNGGSSYITGPRTQKDIHGQSCEKTSKCPCECCSSGGRLATFNKDLMNPQCGEMLPSGAASTLLSDVSSDIVDTFSKELSGGNDWYEYTPKHGWSLTWPWNNESPPQVFTFKNYANNDNSKFTYSYQSINGFKHQCEFNDLFDYDSNIGFYLSMNMDREAPAVSKIYKFHVYYTSPSMNVFCPSATRQIGTSTSGIDGCGLGECDDRFNTESIEECRTECVLNPYCRSFSYAPYYGDRDYPTEIVCSLYNGDKPNANHENVQKLCGLLEDAFTKKLCHSTHRVNIDTGSELYNGILSETLLENSIVFVEIISGKDLLSDIANDYISIQLTSFKDSDYASYLEINVYNNKIVVLRVDPSDNSQYELMSMFSDITSAKSYDFWVQFNADENKKRGFIRFGLGWNNAYSNELLHFPFVNFVEDGPEIADLRLSYESFKYVSVSYIDNTNSMVNGDISFVLYEPCKQEDELSAFVKSFGFLSTEDGTSGKVSINVYVKNNVYSCIVHEVKSNKKNLCTNLNFLKSERCQHDAFRQITHLYDYVMEFVYHDNDYLVLDEFYADDYIIQLENTVFLTNAGDPGNNRALIAFKENNKTIHINGDLINTPAHDHSVVNEGIDITFGIDINVRKSTQILIEVYDDYNRYVCSIIPSLIEDTVSQYLCVSNADDPVYAEEINPNYNYVSYTKTNCISQDETLNKMKIIVDSEGNIEINQVFVNDDTFTNFCGQTNSAVCEKDSGVQTSNDCIRLINCIDAGIASESTPNIKPIIVLNDIFTHSDTSSLDIDSYSSLFKLSIKTCNAPSSTTELSLLLKGVLGSSPREVITNLPNNAFYIYHIGSTPIGIFFSLQLEIDGEDSICLSQVILTDAVTDKILFETDESTIGKGIYLKQNCEYKYMLLENNIFIPCYEQKYLLEAFHNRLHTRITMELCAGDPDEVGLDKLTQQELSVVVTGLDKGDLYLSTDAISLSSDRDWNTTSITDSIREYNIIYDDFDIYSISVVFINNNQPDAICIDKVIINNQKAILNSFWIGEAKSDLQPDLGCHNNRPCEPAIPAVLSWPICKTEITDQRMSLIDRINEDGETLSSTCRNENRFYSGNCAASKSYAYSYSASWESATSSSESRGIEIAQGFELGTSWEIGSEVSLGGEAKVGAEAGTEGTVVAKTTTEVSSTWQASFSSTFGASASFSRSRTSSRETTFERSFSKTTDKTEEETISCEASLEVGPFEEVNYDVTKAIARSKFQTFTDFKLTKCSYILDQDDTNPNHFVYLMNIPGALEFTETTSCSITFYEPKYIQSARIGDDKLTCQEAQKIKGITELNSYVPFCNPDNPEHWDPCQCEIGDKWTDQTCFCVDPSTGLATGAFKAAVVDTGITTWKNWCYQNCDGTQFTPDQPLVDMNGNLLPTNPTTATPTITTLAPTVAPITTAPTTTAPTTKKKAKAVAIQNEIDIIDDKYSIDDKDHKYNILTDDEFEKQLLSKIDTFLLTAMLFLLFCGLVSFVYVLQWIQSCKNNTKTSKYHRVSQYDSEKDDTEI